MPKAIDEHTPRRRGVLGGAAALLAGSTAAVAAAMPDIPAGTRAGPAAGTPDADARLLALIAEFYAMDQQCDALLAGVAELPEEDPASTAARDRYQEQLQPRLLTAQYGIATTPARTRQGLAAKATLALSRTLVMADGTPDEDSELVVSVLHDVLGLPPVVLRRAG